MALDDEINEAGDVVKQKINEDNLRTHIETLRLAHEEVLGPASIISPEEKKARALKIQHYCEALIQATVLSNMMHVIGGEKYGVLSLSNQSSLDFVSSAQKEISTPFIIGAQPNSLFFILDGNIEGENKYSLVWHPRGEEVKPSKKLFDLIYQPSRMRRYLYNNNLVKKVLASSDREYCFEGMAVSTLGSVGSGIGTGLTLGSEKYNSAYIALQVSGAILAIGGIIVAGHFFSKERLVKQNGLPALETLHSIFKQYTYDKNDKKC